MQYTPDELNVVTTDPRQLELEQIWRARHANPPGMARQRWDDELVVYIWRDGGAFGPMGHAALKVRLGAGRVHYISWWPDDEAFGGIAALFATRQNGKAMDHVSDKLGEMSDHTRDRLVANTIQPRAGQQVVVLTDIDDNGEVSNTFSYGQAPDRKIPLPGLTAQSFGLGGSAACNFFFKFLQTDRQYKAASRRHNCAGIVRRALKAAGAEAFVSAPPVPIWARPNEVLEWAEGLSAVMQAKNAAAQRFLTTHRAARRTMPRDLGTGGQVTGQHWRRVSRRPSGIRGQNVKSLDPLVEKMTTALRTQDVPTFLKARVKAFDIIDRAVSRPGRDAHDKKLLVALGLSLLRPFMPQRPAGRG